MIENRQGVLESDAHIFQRGFFDATRLSRRDWLDAPAHHLRECGATIILFENTLKRRTRIIAEMVVGWIASLRAQ
jgi:hypothetical protein